ncbi:MAG: MOSC domain-containing protein [Longimicrobiales bacterium]
MQHSLNSATATGGREQGRVAGLFIASERGQPLRAVASVRAVPGWGLEGDRYWGYSRRLSRDPGRACAITLIAAEALDVAAREHGLELAPIEARRNVLTRHVDLNALVDRDFSVDEVWLRGLMLCEPCNHLRKLTGKEVLRPLVHRGGLRAEILSEGMIRVGAAITVCGAARAPGPA